MPRLLRTWPPLVTLAALCGVILGGVALSCGGRADADPPPAPAAPAAPAAGLVPRSSVPLGNEVPGLALPPGRRADPAEGFAVIDAATAARTLRWVVAAGATAPGPPAAVKYVEHGRSLLVALPPDTLIDVQAIAVIDGQVAVARTHLLVAGPAAPRPPPAAGGTEPTPSPAASPLYVILVEDPVRRAEWPFLADIVNDRPLHAALAAAGHSWTVLSCRDPEVQRTRLDRHVAAAGGVPALILMDRAGAVRSAARCPPTAAAVLAAVAAAGPAAGPAAGR